MPRIISAEQGTTMLVATLNTDELIKRLKVYVLWLLINAHQ